MNELKDKQKLPDLLRMQDKMKMIIPKAVEEKIRYLINKFPHTEWSGVLFYTHTGSFEDKDLTVTCQDFFPMDLGDATFTSFNVDGDVTQYISEHLDLIECDWGLIHSHHTMSTTFSGTDMSTVQSEGNEKNCFVSLIVNTAGSYSAVITRKVKTVCKIASITTFYEFFGLGPKTSNKNDQKNIEKETIQYFYFDISVEKPENHLSYLDKRFDDIEQKKKPVHQLPLLNSNMQKTGYSEDLFGWMKDEKVPNVRILNSPKPQKTKKYNSTDLDAYADKALRGIMTGNLVPEDFDVPEYIMEGMDDFFESHFINDLYPEASLEAWLTFSVSYFVSNLEQPDNYDSDIPWEYEVANRIDSLLVDYCKEIPGAMTNHYIQLIMNELTVYTSDYE